MKRLLCTVLLLAASASAVPGQSLFATRGLGVPIDPIDTRARSLGNSGLGLLGLNASMVNPAELAGIARRGVIASLEPFYGKEKIGGTEDNVASTRFPVIQLIYPARERLVFALGYGGFLDQSWSVITNGNEILGSDTVATRDLVSARGGIGQLKLSASYELSSVVALGLSVGAYTGNLEREITRVFPDSVQTGLTPFTTRSRWDYLAPFVTVGARLDPSSRVRVAGTLTWSGDLDATAREGEVEDRSYKLPLRAGFGASAILTRSLMATASASWTGWSKTASYAALGTPASTATSAQTTWDVGVGLESEELRTSTRVFPLRVGFRYAKLPFYQVGESRPTEWSAGFGVGFRLAADEFGPLAVADAGVERGKRTGWKGSLLPDGLEENFWRFSASISLFGR